jgi:hypothetical protein
MPKVIFVLRCGIINDFRTGLANFSLPSIFVAKNFCGFCTLYGLRIVAISHFFYSLRNLQTNKSIRLPKEVNRKSNSHCRFEEVLLATELSSVLPLLPSMLFRNVHRT